MNKLRHAARALLLSGLSSLPILAFLLAPAGASALVTHQFKASFGSANQPAFFNAGGLAVDQASGDLLVIDQAAGTLSRFHADGTPSNFSALGSNVIGELGFGGPSEVQVAVDNSGTATDGDIYLAHSARVDIFGEDGTLLGALTESSEGPFGEACGVGVDPSGAVYVGDFSIGKVHKYVPTASPPVVGDNTLNFTVAIPCTLAAGAGASTGSVFVDIFGAANTKFDSSSGEEKYIVNNNPITTTTVNPASGNVYTATENEVKEFDATGATEATLLSSFSAPGTVRGVAVDEATGNVYVSREGKTQIEVWGPAVALPDVSTEAATPIDEESVSLNGTISAAGGPEAECKFQLTTEAAFNANGFTGATELECPPPNSFTGSGVEAVSVEASGLTAGTTYFFRLVGSNENGSNPALASKAGALSFRIGPAVLTSAADEITATAATVRGLIEPNAGEEVSYQVEYGPTEAYGSLAPSEPAAALVPLGTGIIEFGSKTITEVAMNQGKFVVGQEIRGEGIVPGTTVTKIVASTLTLSKFPTSGGFVELSSPTAAISQRLNGLTPGTLYHFRIVAKGAATVNGPDGTFTTFAQQGEAGTRAYELVSPAQKIGEVLVPGGNAGSCGECLPGENEMTMPMQARPDGEALIFEGQPFSSGLAPSANDYLTQRSEAGWSTAQSITPTRAAKGGEDQNSGFKALSADLSRGVLYQAQPALSEEVPPGEGGKSYNDLYLWEAGNPQVRPLVTVKPPNRAAIEPTGDNAFQLAYAGADQSFTHIVFEANDALTSEVPGIAPEAPEAGEAKCGGFAASACDLYEWVGGQLRLVNVLPGNTEAAAAGAVIGSGRRLAEAQEGLPALADLQAADVDHAISDDGSKIFWSDAAGQLYVRIDGNETVEVKDPGHGQFLTAAADGSKVLLSDGCLYDLESGECEATLSNTLAGFLGIMGASEDLSRIYFVSTDALPGTGAVAETCETAVSPLALEELREGKVPAGNGCNLYAYVDGEVRLIARLNADDNMNTRYGSWKASRSNRNAQVSPDGRYLAFAATASLTGYDNRAVRTGTCYVGGCLEVYEYDSKTGSLSCPSCSPTGQRPSGVSTLSLIRPFGLPAPLRQPENLSSEGKGRLFFESQDTLLAKDTNGKIQDVYEWMPNGVGSCARAGGCLALISSGNAPNDSMFLDSTPSGRDAFFITRQQLVAEDEDELLDVYDARVGGGNITSPPAPCEGEGCKGPVSPAPQLPSSGSQGFEGPGNQKPPHKKKHHKKRHHKRKHHKRKHHKVANKHKVPTASIRQGGAK